MTIKQPLYPHDESVADAIDRKNNRGKNNMHDITKTIEQFRKAILMCDTSVLQQLLAEALSYGHSDGHVEGKNEFILKIGNGTYQFLTMDLTQQSITETGNLAVVRHELDAQTNDEGKPGEAHLYVLLVWTKEKGEWKLIARQAVKKAP